MEPGFTIRDRVAAFIGKARTVRNVAAALTALIIAAAMAVFAADIQVPHVFQPGDVISASKINDNFKVLQDQVNRLARDVKGVPVGTIVAYGGLDANVPDGWLLCNGQELIGRDYSEHLEYIGTLWGDGNSVTTFNLPDLRGIFLRGVNHGRTGAFSDPDASVRVGYDGSAVGDRVGSFQDDAFKSHLHRIYFERPAFHASGNWGDYFPAEEGSIIHQTTAEGGSETRSVNASVNYIIKVQ
jgi:hypothetical protein